MRNQVEGGFTLAEVVTVALLASLILIPAYRLLSTGVNTSVQGMHQIDLVLEARRVIRQIHADLKSSCLELDPSRRYTLLDFLRIQRPATGNLEGTSYEFFAFPLHADVEQVISAQVTTGVAPRLANRITYRIERGPGPLFRLIREEKANPLLGGPDRRSVLTQRLNQLLIVPTEIKTPAGDAQWVFQVTLQLGEIRSTPQAQAAPSRPALVTTDRTKGVLLADFFDVVSSEFFQAMWNQECVNRNWHTVIRTP
ncbi:MAG: hypothetical protein OZSIB_0756 [Candidatus Ozemobacter sibiricus]|jgi:hypothetical protein|uniref:Prepilin-type N-terminal cleavage/methylation domain-containing protein n=1 Tax=Candidatus Ozemobacter sibiricus TaxID=2268124 RepID=A0A367ZW90_9BACT|nr:MAG: hypothetical protein OZSIB_0756 [Candidatus Ozemobacter sibiricus]